MLRATGRACKTRPPDPFFLGPARPKPGSKSPEARGLFPGFFQEKLILYFGIILYIISYTMTSEYLLNLWFYIWPNTFCIDQNMQDHTEETCWVKKKLIITSNKLSHRYLGNFYCTFFENFVFTMQHLFY